jgi:hypothetical protein
VHCPAAAEEVEVLDSDLATRLEVVVVVLVVEAEDETLEEVFTLLLVDEMTVELVEDLALLLLLVEAVEDFTVLVTRDDVLEVLLVEDFVVPTLLDLTLAQTNCVCPISHTPLILKDSNTMLSIAFKFAPVKELNATVYVWVAPVIPVKVVK